MNREPDSWITINGQHVPIFEGESKREAVSKFVKNKMSRVSKNKDKYDTISQYKKRKSTNKLDKKDDNDRKFIKYKNKYLVGSKDQTDDEIIKHYEDVHKDDREMTPEERWKMEYNFMKADKKARDKKKDEFDWRGEKKDYKKLVQKGDNQYIVVRNDETEDEAIRKFNERENLNKQREIEEKRSQDEINRYNESVRRANLMKFTQNNREQINKWVSEYDDETHKRVGEKVLRGEALTAKEYFGFLGSDLKPGDVIWEEFPDNEDAIVANDGNFVRRSRIKEYNKNPKANQDAVYSQRDDDEWDRILEEENSIKDYFTWDERHKNDINPFNKKQKEKIDKFKKRKSSNK